MWTHTWLEWMFASLALATVLPWAWRRARSGPAGAAAPLAALAGAALLLLLARAVFVPRAAALAPPLDRPIAEPGGGYVSSDACVACHPHQYATWWHSYHRTMTQVADETSVLAPFDDVTLSYDGHVYRLEHREDGFWVDQDLPRAIRRPPPRVRQRVALVTGSHHVQVYWLPTGTSRKLDLFQFVWRIPEQRWVPIDAIFLYPPDVRQLSQGAGRWNIQCQRCHATRPLPRIAGKEMDTRIAELGIACEACHGPGGAHVARMQSPLARYAAHLGMSDDLGVVDPRDLPPERSAHVCGQCHSVFTFRDPEDVSRWRREGYATGPATTSTTPGASSSTLPATGRTAWCARAAASSSASPARPAMPTATRRAAS